MISPLDRKLQRDLWRIKGQLAAIILVMAAGIAIFIITFGVLDSLKLTRDTYYQRYQFADLFASLKRAPLSLKPRIDEIPGVVLAETRVTFGMTLQMPNLDEPATGRLISIESGQSNWLNQLYLRRGRWPLAGESDAVLVDESFFVAHDLTLGESISTIINGHQRQLKVVGVALSPEYVYTIAPGAMMPDGKRYGVFWMDRTAVAALANMRGAFNDVLIRLANQVEPSSVKQALDQLLKPYGGLMSYGRDEQISSFFVDNEIKQLQAMGLMAPIIFLSVAAFLINVVMSRQVATQREQIGMLKAVGYSDGAIAWHFLKMALLILAFGAVIGLVVGSWMGAGMTKMYTQFFHFPILKYSFSAKVMIFAVLFSAVAAVLGTLFAVNRASKLAPAEAMRPQSPVSFRASWLQRLGLHNWLSFLSRIVLRQLERRPLRALLSATGMAFAFSILVFSFFMEDSMTHLMDVQYDLSQREDVNLAFVEAVGLEALDKLQGLPGVLKVEPVRQVAVNLKHQHWQKRGSLTGLLSSGGDSSEGDSSGGGASAELRQIINTDLKPVLLPSQGVLVNQKLAEILHLQVGDSLEVEVLEEKRPTLNLTVSGITQEYIGLNVYIELRNLSRLLDSEPKMNGALLMIDANSSAQLFHQIKKIPQIAALNIVSVLRQIFDQIMAENLLKMVSTNILFASFICFGVVYNTARIAVSERGRELASLRVLGLTRREVAYLLFGELGLITLLSLPLGGLLGTWLALGMVSSMESELFRIPLYINHSTYGYAVLIVLACTLLSFYLVWRQVNQIDLVSAQKGVD